MLAGLLRLPFSPLERWPWWSLWRRHKIGKDWDLALFLAAGLREAWEEMRLNPLCINFLGPLPEQELATFKRFIHPLAGWVAHRRCSRFKPNWEVQRIVDIPLKRLLDPSYYARFRPMIRPLQGGQIHMLRNTYFPCFIHHDEYGRELLWGATYRIVQSFLNLVFDFKAPEIASLPIVQGFLDPTYPDALP